MPPWLPEPGYGDFADERRLTDEQIQLFDRWLKAGTPEGSAADAPRAPVFTQGWQLGRPDLIVQAPGPFPVPPDGSDLFWNFILAPSVAGARYVRAVEIRPGNKRAVHHANLLIDRTRSSRGLENSPGAGFPGMDLTIEADTFDPDSHFLFWKPGSIPYVEPDGLAWRLDSGNDLVLNTHLQPSGKTEMLRPEIGLYLTDKPQTKFPILIQLEHDGALDIPAGARDFLASDDFTLPEDAGVLGIYPHAHYLGKLLEGYATLPDGARKWLIRIPDWDLNWQAVYRYREPVFLPKGSVISMRFHYDNSSANPRNPNHPPKRVRGGNRAVDEMGHLWLQLLPRGEGDRRMEIQEAFMRHTLQKYPADFSAHFNLGALLLERRDVEGAIRYLAAAVRIQPDRAVALNTLGAALQAAGRSAEAAEQFRRALGAQPDYANARYNLANALAAQGALDEAAAAFRAVMRQNPNDSTARERLIAVLTELGNSADAARNLKDAGRYYEELTRLEPEDPDIRNNYGAILARQGRWREAESQFEAALRVDPLHSAARGNLERARKQ